MRRIFIFVLLFAMPAFARTYSTTCANTENPISENGNWLNANQNGYATSWTPMQSVTVSSVHMCTGTELSSSANDDDSTAILQGTWGPNQTATAVVRRIGNPAAEIEIRLRSNLTTSNQNTGYECNFAPGYAQIVKWNGALNSFTALANPTGTGPGVAHGDTVSCSIDSAGLITEKINGTTVHTATDSTYTTGNPGIGFFNAGGGDPTQTDLAFTSFTVTDGLPAQPSAGIIDEGRAIDWRQAGIPGALPSAVWTQCGTTIAAYDGSAGTINTAITNCGSSQYVQLGSGTFHLTSGITNNGKNNVAIRGQGANSTSLIFSGAGAGHYNSIVAFEPSGLNESNGSEQNVCDVSAGLTQGSTQITLSNCGSTAPAKGALSNLKVGSVIMVSQLDEAADNGTIWNCLAGVSEGGAQCANNPVGSAGEARHNGTTITGSSYRSQEQGFVVTAIAGSVITVSPAVYMPNWSSAQKPQAWFATSPITKVGLENLTVDATAAGSGQSILIGNCNQCWVRGVRSIMANRSHIRILFSTHYQIQDNYLYGNISHATVSYGVEMFGGWDGLIVNNIFQQSTDSEPSCSGSCEGNVVAYNFDINNVYVTAGWEQAGNYLHASGTAYNLWEGNVGDGYNADDVHGTHAFDTVFRNYMIGIQYAGCGSAGNSPACTLQTTPIILQAGARYFNIIGNVLGKSGYHNNYTCNATSTASCGTGNTSIFVTGYSGNGGQQASAVNGFCSSPACTARGAFDPQVGSYLMRWLNYDTVNAAVRSVSGEVPSTIATFPNSIPFNQTLPSSLYYASAPSWWPNSIPFPPIGPDVTGGTATGSNGGTTWVSQSLGGHANDIPAQACFKSVMGGPADGTGSALSFNADTCYPPGGSNPPPPTVPVAPSNLLILVSDYIDRVFTGGL